MEMLPETFKTLLNELAEWLDFEDCEPVDWVVCGGTALMLQGLQTRVTRDVDVLGNWHAQSMEITLIEDFPEKVKACIQKVIENHAELSGLKNKWVNLGASRLAKFGLPKGFEQRLVTMQFGKKLTLHLLGRADLIPLKLYAASDGHGPRQDIHFQDLHSMKPTYDELDRAVEWMRTLKDFEEKRIDLKELVQRLGHDDLAYYI
ncbi:MAG: hypothetical protein HZA50_16325 [Planctomycetes bacterium]|nr:hypothetical protein [Planctomycetota bacterium]